MSVFGNKIEGSEIIRVGLIVSYNFDPKILNLKVIGSYPKDGIKTKNNKRNKSASFLSKIFVTPLKLTR